MYVMLVTFISMWNLTATIILDETSGLSYLKVHLKNWLLSIRMPKSHHLYVYHHLIVKLKRLKLSSKKQLLDIVNRQIMRNWKQDIPKSY